MKATLKRRNHLYTLRRIRGLRQKQFAQLLGYRSTTMISRFEHGVSHPPLKVALLMEIVLGAKLAEIYMDDYQDLQRLILRRCDGFPPFVRRHIRGRLLGTD